VLRENLKSEAIKIISMSRQTMLEMGRRMIGTEVVEQPDDVFFLDMDEFIQVWRGEMEISKTSALIKNRRKEYIQSSNIKPPSIIRGIYKKDESPAEKKNLPELSILKGLGISAGNVIGKARVVKREDEEVKVQPGEIIIAPFSDPGWTPHFIPAAGIVMDMGGLLSHGSIIAREYGIPAVVNVGHATELIKTGQLIEVDGTNGIVKILKNK
jgi:pyruvate,water dikinase